MRRSRRDTRNDGHRSRSRERDHHRRRRRRSVAKDEEESNKRGRVIMLDRDPLVDSDSEDHSKKQKDDDNGMEDGEVIRSVVSSSSDGGDSSSSIVDVVSPQFSQIVDVDDKYADMEKEFAVSPMQDRTEDRLFELLCSNTKYPHVIHHAKMSRADALMRYGTAHMVRVDEVKHIIYFTSMCCKECNLVDYHYKAVVSELKRVYREHETSVTVHDVYFTYDNNPRRGDFQGKVARMELTRVSRDKDRGDHIFLQVELWVELFPNGHPNNKNRFKITGMFEHADKPKRTVRWSDKRVYAVIHDEMCITYKPDCVTSRVDRVYPGTQCKRTCRKDHTGKCLMHGLKKARILDPVTE